MVPSEIKITKKSLKNKISDILYHVRPPYAGSSCDKIFGFEVYGYKGNFPTIHKLFILPIHSVLRKIDDVYYWFYNRFIKRHHIVVTDLKPGWCDVDEVMFRACFALLGRFVESELGKADSETAIIYGHHRGYRLHCFGNDNQQAIDLWLWYKNDLKELEDLEMSDYKNFTKKYGYDYIDEQKNEKLLKLMEIRQTLWT